ncbi:MULTISPECIES: serine hydrolase [Burkholderia]|uniref:serine hydrolase domain-containing protein n=1 Tax=Burkholderia TaxID=32008 RepID=UPI0004691829|nr:MULTISPECIES: serine hydrolase [Burkholderia]NIE81982.1 serine hydrolase [Burkholderia sp. Tr-860]NIF61212.1 serine hydrolase [Burkholderia sp. Cy-647]NIF70106.1 serine hydrolase [Burkholderia sp. Ap-962]NIF94137.1 serine hydrolase [Burkholderia sp. Ax-1720]
MIPARFESDYGFRRDSVRHENWRDAPWNVWAFRHVHELIPSARIAATPGLAEPPLVDAEALTRHELEIGGERRTVASILRETWTDAITVMRGGRIVADFHAPNFTLQSRHILFSASKSVAGLLAGMLYGDGLLDPEAPVAHYVPELARSAFGDARVRHVLDMRTSLAFNEDYLDPNGIYARYRRAGLLDPRRDGEPRETVLELLAALPKGEGEHGGPFHYCSPNSDVLGLVIERASGERYADFASRRLWQALDLRQDGCVTVDIAGTARSGGGLCMGVRDLARVGELVRLGGNHQGRRLIPADWMEDTLTGGSAEAWRQGDFSDWLPNGKYRNKWYQLGNASGACFAIGIHGQWLYVDRANETVIAKFSSQPWPTNNDVKHLNLALFEALASMR